MKGTLIETILKKSDNKFSTIINKILGNSNIALEIYLKNKETGIYIPYFDEDLYKTKFELLKNNFLYYVEIKYNYLNKVILYVQTWKL